MKIGDRVTFSLGGGIVVGIVIEDRGPLGPGGVRLLRVQIESTDPPVEPLRVEVREDRLKKSSTDNF